MNIEPNLLNPASALFGALAGGLASMIGAIYTHRRNERLQRIASEVAKRETIYADFVMSAANLLLKAYTSDELTLSGDEQRLIGLVNRMRIWDKNAALDKAMKHQGLFDRDNTQKQESLQVQVLLVGPP